MTKSRPGYGVLGDIFGLGAILQHVCSRGRFQMVVVGGGASHCYSEYLDSMVTQCCARWPRQRPGIADLAAIIENAPASRDPARLDDSMFNWVRW